MKITKGKLQQIIQEELGLLNEEVGDGELSPEEAEKLKSLVGDAVADASQDEFLLGVKKHHGLMDARDYLTNVLEMVPEGQQRQHAAIYAAAAFKAAGDKANARGLIAEDFDHLWNGEPDTLKAILDFIAS
jgi:DNA-binding helix-hairpin-helix protein with protein kinase domain